MDPKNRMAWGAIASMLGVLAWTVFISLFAVWWAPNLSLFQNLVVLIASLVATAVVIGIGWMAYGMRHGWQMEGQQGGAPGASERKGPSA